MATPKICDVLKPVVGKYYLVPCVKNVIVDDVALQEVYAKQKRTFFPIGPYAKAGIWIPVRGTKHEDGKYFGVPNHHYHYDWRFVKGAVLSALNVTHGGDVKHELKEKDITSYAFGKYHGKVCFTALLADSTTHYRQMKMVRADGVFPNNPGFKARNGFEDDYIGRKALPGNLCPHKAAKLDGAPKDSKGRIVCPCHGLCFNPDTMVVEPRFPTAKAEDDFLQNEYNNMT